jgi:hypothetical protein
MIMQIDTVNFVLRDVKLVIVPHVYHVLQVPSYQMESVYKYAHKPNTLILLPTHVKLVIPLVN